MRKLTVFFPAEKISYNVVTSVATSISAQNITATIPGVATNVPAKNIRITCETGGIIPPSDFIADVVLRAKITPKDLEEMTGFKPELSEIYLTGIKIYANLHVIDGIAKYWNTLKYVRVGTAKFDEDRDLKVGENEWKECYSRDFVTPYSLNKQELEIVIEEHVSNLIPFQPFTRETAFAIQLELQVVSYYKIRVTLKDVMGKAVSGEVVVRDAKTGSEVDRKYGSDVYFTVKEGEYLVEAYVKERGWTDSKYVSVVNKDVLVEFTNIPPVPGAEQVKLTVITYGLINKYVVPLPGIKVTVGNMVEYTNSDGKAEFLVYKGGTYTILCEDEKYNRYKDTQKTVTVTQPMTVELYMEYMEVPKYKIEVYVFDEESGIGVPNVVVKVLDSTGRVVASGRTDTNGVAEIRNVPEGTYTLVASDGVEGSAKIEVNAMNLEFSLGVKLKPIISPETLTLLGIGGLLAVTAYIIAKTKYKPIRYGIRYGRKAIEALRREIAKLREEIKRAKE